MQEKTWCVYAHINKTNNKMYIGITSQPVEQRWMGGHGYDKKCVFGRAIKKYGWDGFNHIVLSDGLAENDAKSAEIALISIFSTMDRKYGYNMTAGGEGVTGLKFSEESRRKLSIATSGANHPNYGKHLSATTREKISKRLIGNKNSVGCVMSDNARRKIAQSKYKPVAACLNGDVVDVYGSAMEAGQILGINRKNISLCCKGFRKHAGGYEWKFV